jgi:hypothetical protein
MVELSWPAQEVMQEHLQNLISQMYMIVAEGYLCARGSCISCSSDGIHRGVRGVLRVMLWCAITSISSLVVVLLQLGAASPDSFGDPTYSCLCDPVRGLHGD